MRFLRFLSPALLLALAACGGSDTPTAPSEPARSSHNAGRNCMDCHSFSVAGTAYRDDGSISPGAVVRITSQPAGAGDVLLNVTADASGNFYSSQPVSWGDGLYTDARGSGTPRAMQASISSGACNSCHAGADRIRVD